ncbi:MAG: DUF4827 domain-containing protein [Bacteroidales bacterium]|jgi:hypothetical protein|nr:DUF4827 domain-containing protein [Bacteroidales bacterium]
MRKLLLFFFALILLPGVWVACNNTKTYAELLKDEQDAIDRFIRDSGFVVYNHYLETFGEKDFVKLPNGLYLNVVEPGNPQPVDSGKVVLYRIKYAVNLFQPAVAYAGNWHSGLPNQFIYGRSSWEGISTPLKYVGENTVIRIIVPSSLNISEIMETVTPYYYYLKYTENVMGN